MFARYKNPSTILIAIALGLGLTLSACGGGGIGQEDVDAIRAQLEAVEERLDEVHALLVSADGEIEGNGVELVGEAQQELEASRDALAEVLAELEPPPPPPEPDPATAPGGLPADPGF